VVVVVVEFVEDGLPVWVSPAGAGCAKLIPFKPGKKTSSKTPNTFFIELKEFIEYP